MLKFSLFFSVIFTNIEFQQGVLNGKYINSQYSRNGGNNIPIFTLSNINKDYFAIFIWDKTTNNNFVHWFIYDIQKNQKDNFLQDIQNGNISQYSQFQNDFGQKQYDGPQPPNEHQYIIEAYQYSNTIESIIKTQSCDNENTTYEKIICLMKLNRNINLIGEKIFWFDPKKKLALKNQFNFKKIKFFFKLKIGHVLKNIIQ